MSIDKNLLKRTMYGGGDIRPDASQTVSWVESYNFKGTKGISIR